MEGHISSSGKPPTVDLGRFRNHDGDELCCIVCVDRTGRRHIEKPLVTLPEARAYAEGYNSIQHLTGSRVEIRKLSGTLALGKKISLTPASRKAGAK